MERDKILKEKDKIQQQLWNEAKKSTTGYAALVHTKAQKVLESLPGTTSHGAGVHIEHMSLPR